MHLDDLSTHELSWMKIFKLVLLVAGMSQPSMRSVSIRIRTPASQIYLQSIHLLEFVQSKLKHCDFHRYSWGTWRSSSTIHWNWAAADTSPGWAMKNNPYPTPLSWLVDGIPTMAYNLYAFVRILYDKRNSKPLIGYLPPISSETGDCSLLPHKSIPINQVLSGLSGNLG